MHNNSLSTLKQLDTQKLALKLSNSLKEIGKGPEQQISSIGIAFVLYMAETNETIKINTFSEFEKTSGISKKLCDIIKRFTANVWEAIPVNEGKFTSDELLAFILFNDELGGLFHGEHSTPSSVSKLALKILDLKEHDSLLNLCSGQGSFAVESYIESSQINFLGIELNYSANEIAILRSSLLEGEFAFQLSDALTVDINFKANKIFSNYPFMLKSPAVKDKKGQIRKTLGLNEDMLKRVSSDWIFNIKVIEHLDDNGKAVVIMTNGSSWNRADLEIRKYFVENGYIEAVIALPSHLFMNTAISTTLIVLSKGNKFVRLIDAHNSYKKERKFNVLDDKNIANIVKSLTTDNDMSIIKTFEEMAQNEYILNATRYLNILPEIKDGVELDSVITSVTRGIQIKAKDLDKFKSNTESDYQYLMMSNIKDGIIHLGEEQYLSEIPNNFNKYCVPNNALVISKIGTPNFKSAVVQIDEGKKILVNGSLFIIELDETKINPFYLQAFFASALGVASFNSIRSGTAVATISLNELRKMIIPLPPLEEQMTIAQRYAASLDEIVLLSRKLERVISDAKHIFDAGGLSC